MKNRIFEWDEKKRILNIEKHHIDFNDAREIFDDANRIETEIIHSSGEIRHITMGSINGIIFLAVYTLRGEITRLISVRRASKDERNTYYSTS